MGEVSRSERLRASRALSWLLLPSAELLRQLPRALLVSVLAAAFDVAGLVVLVELATLTPSAASAISYLWGGMLQYLLSVTWVFAAAQRPQSPRAWAGHFLHFQLLSLVGLGITWCVIHTAHQRSDLHYGLAKMFALGLAFAWNFSSRRWLVFAEKPRDS